MTSAQHILNELHQCHEMNKVNKNALIAAIGAPIGLVAYNIAKEHGVHPALAIGGALGTYVAGVEGYHAGKHVLRKIRQRRKEHKDRSQGLLKDTKGIVGATHLERKNA